MNDDPTRSDFDSEEEAVFEMSQDIVSAKRQIQSNTKLLSDAESRAALYKELADTSIEETDTLKWRNALSESHILQDMLRARIAKLENALSVLEKAVRQLQT